MLLDKLRARRKNTQAETATATPSDTPADREAQALQQRYVQWATLQPAARADWPPPAAQVLDPAVAIPDLPAAELTDEVLADGLLNHGALIIRGYLPAATAGELRADVDRVMDMVEEIKAGQQADGDDGGAAAWRRPLVDPRTGEQVGAQWRAENSIFSGEASVGDSPHMAAKLSEIYEQIGLTQLVANYLGEPPAVSLEKWVLRRVPPATNTSWHQDGYLIGQTVRAVNVWFALSDCGVDASGLDIVPKRYDTTVQTGTEGAYFHWDVGQGVVDRELAGAEVLSPVFAPGDAVIFDQFLLHRTGVKPGMTKDRYAIETWFFAPSHWPDQYHGILL